METKTTFILGPPASGKTTAIEFFSQLIKKQKKSFIYLDDNLILREVCNKYFQTPVDYFYRNEQLILTPRSRKKIITETHKKIYELFLENINKFNYIFVEFTSPDFEAVLKNEFKSVMSSVLIYIISDYQKITKRNNNRKNQDKVPSEYIGLFKDNIQKKDSLKKYFKQVFFIKNNQNLSFFKKEIQKIFTQIESV